MKRPPHVSDHYAAPKAWRHTPNMTGDYDMDASIMHSRNPAIASKLSMYLSPTTTAYQPKTGYRGGAYSGYSGDD